MPLLALTPMPSVMQRTLSLITTVPEPTPPIFRVAIGALAWLHMWSDEAVGYTHSLDLQVSALSDFDPSRSKDEGAGAGAGAFLFLRRG